MTLEDLGAGSSRGIGAFCTLASTNRLQRDLVFVFELLGVELAGLPLDELFGEGELVFLDGDRLDFGEVAGGIAQLLGVAHDVGHHAGQLFIGWRRDGDEVLAAAEGDLAESDLSGLAQRLANHGEGLSLCVSVGNDEVGLLEVRRIDLASRRRTA